MWWLKWLTFEGASSFCSLERFFNKLSILKLVKHADCSLEDDELLDDEQIKDELFLQLTLLSWLLLLLLGGLDMSIGDEDELDIGDNDELSSLSSSALKLP